MFKSLPIKKDHLFILAVLILLAASYQLAFKKTITAWQLHQHLEQQLAQSADISTEPQYQQRRNANLDKIINLHRADSSEFRAGILNHITLIAGKEQVKLSEVPARDPLYRSSPIIIQRLNITGNYFALAKTLDRLQHTQGTGIIRSIDLKAVTGISGKEKTKKLSTNLYFEIYDK